ncbi:hypothetical protein CUAC110533_09260 [Cutibacterium acnes subsp. elongatum]
MKLAPACDKAEANVRPRPLMARVVLGGSAAENWAH